VGIRCADHATPSIRNKFALTSPTSGGRSVGTVRLRTKATGFRFLVYFLFNVCDSISSNTAPNEWTMKWEWCGRKRSWQNLRYCPGINQNGMRQSPQPLRTAAPRTRHQQNIILEHYSSSELLGETGLLKMLQKGSLRNGRHTKVGVRVSEWVSVSRVASSTQDPYSR
jgi:hypothetical protein